MGSYFTKSALPQRGGHELESVLWDSQPLIVINKNAQQLTEFDEAYLIPQLENCRPSQSSPDLLARSNCAETPGAEIWSDPVVTQE